MAKGSSIYSQQTVRRMRKGKKYIYKKKINNPGEVRLLSLVETLLAK